VTPQSNSTAFTTPGLTQAQVITRGVVGASAAAGVFGLCYVGQQAGENASQWPDFVTNRVGHTYKYFAGGLALTATSAYLLFQSGALHRVLMSHPLAFSLGGFAVTIGSMFTTLNISQENTLAKMSAFAVFNAAMGASIAPSFYLGGPLVLRAAMYTGAVVGGLSLVGMSARSDQFLSWGQPLAFGLGVVCVTSLGRIFLPVRFLMAHSVMENVVMYGGMAVFSGLVWYDTQKIIYKAKYSKEFDAVNESIHIYLDAVNLFQLILSFLSNRKK
jgi:FtsH-binding integral membrane protein